MKLTWPTTWHLQCITWWQNWISYGDTIVYYVTYSFVTVSLCDLQFYHLKLLNCFIMWWAADKSLLKCIDALHNWSFFKWNMQPWKQLEELWRKIIKGDRMKSHHWHCFVPPPRQQCQVKVNELWKCSGSFYWRGDWGFSKYQIIFIFMVNCMILGIRIFW